MVPPAVLSKGVEQLSDAVSRDAVNSLRYLLKSVQQANDLKTFAPCCTCRFDQKRENSFVCELTRERLTDRDVELLCREHQLRL